MKGTLSAWMMHGGAACVIVLAGCGHPAAPPGLSPAARADAAAWQISASREPLPLDPGRERLTQMLLDSLRKRLMGRLESPRNAERIVREIAPLVAAAARQPAVQGMFRQIARDNGISVEAARARWMTLQEADLLLESGGDPDAVSVSDAVGVAQWLATTANGNGLPVDVKASDALTKKIDALKQRIAWLEYALRPDADLSVPGAPAALSRAEAAAKLPSLRRDLERLRAKRRRVDTRYDPRKAIFAQTRYLLRLYPRYPSFDWMFQAYHGGEGGVKRTLTRYLGSAWPGSAAAAIRRGKSGRRLSFEEVYFSTTPCSRPAAFAYVYGRSDEHRYYWWKLRVAQEALALYRRDPAAFQRRWEAYKPGRTLEAAWYPDAPSRAMADLPALRLARTRGDLVPAAAAEFAVRPAPHDKRHGAQYEALLRPEAKGALLLVAAAYRRAGGSGRLSAGDLALTQEYLRRAEALHPPPPPKGPPPGPDAQTLPGGGPPDMDYHVTGIAFDIIRPSDSRNRRLLDYVLGYFSDRQILWRREMEERGSRVYHVVPNPRYAAILARIGADGQIPNLPGL